MRSSTSRKRLATEKKPSADNDIDAPERSLPAMSPDVTMMQPESSHFDNIIEIVESMIRDKNNISKCVENSDVAVEHIGKLSNALTSKFAKLEDSFRQKDDKIARLKTELRRLREENNEMVMKESEMLKEAAQMLTLVEQDRVQIETEFQDLQAKSAAHIEELEKTNNKLQQDEKRLKQDASILKQQLSSADDQAQSLRQEISNKDNIIRDQKAQIGSLLPMLDHNEKINEDRAQKERLLIQREQEIKHLSNALVEARKMQEIHDDDMKKIIHALEGNNAIIRDLQAKLQGEILEKTRIQQRCEQLETAMDNKNSECENLDFEMQQLEAKIEKEKKQFHKQIDQYELKIASHLNELERSKNSIKELETLNQEMTITMQALDNKLLHTNTLRREAEGKQEVLANINNGLQERIQELLSTSTTIEQTVNDLQKQLLQASNDAIDRETTHTIALDIHTQEQANLALEKTAVEAQVSALQAEIDAAKKNMETLTLERMKLENDGSAKAVKIQQLEDERAALQTRVDSLADEKALLSASLEDLRRALAQSADEKGAEVLRLAQDKAALEEQVRVMDGELSALRREKTAVEEEHAAQCLTLNSLSQEKAALEGDLDEMARSKTAVEAQVSALQAEIDAAKKDTETTTLERAAQVQQLEDERAALQTRVDSLADEKALLSAKLEADGNARAAQVQQLEARLLTLKYDLSRVKDELIEVRSERDSFSFELDDLCDEKVFVEQSLASTRASNDALQEEMKALKQQIANQQKLLTELQGIESYRDQKILEIASVKLEKRKISLRADELNAALAAKNKENESVLRELDGLQEEIQTLRAGLAKHHEAEVEALQSRCAAVQESLEATEQQLSKLNSTHRTVLEDFEKTKEQLNAMERERDEKAHELDRVALDLSSIRDRCASLEEEKSTLGEDHQAAIARLQSALDQQSEKANSDLIAVREGLRRCGVNTSSVGEAVELLFGSSSAAQDALNLSFYKPPILRSMSSVIQRADTTVRRLTEKVQTMENEAALAATTNSQTEEAHQSVALHEIDESKMDDPQYLIDQLINYKINYAMVTDELDKLKLENKRNKRQHQAELQQAMDSSKHSLRTLDNSTHTRRTSRSIDSTASRASQGLGRMFQGDPKKKKSIWDGPQGFLDTLGKL